VRNQPTERSDADNAGRTSEIPVVTTKRHVLMGKRRLPLLGAADHVTVTGHTEDGGAWEVRIDQVLGVVVFRPQFFAR
jgi:hypothetical protein